MTLSDADVDRWSRHILLPEVGGRGQQRLLAARVGLTRPPRPHPVADAVEDLLARAGISILLPVSAADLDLSIDLTGNVPNAAQTAVPLVRGVCHGATACVATLVGRPCAGCAPRDGDLEEDGPGGDCLGGAAAAACAALVTAEVMRALLAPPGTGRLQRIDLRRGTFAGKPFVTAGCRLCGESHG